MTHYNSLINVLYNIVCTYIEAYKDEKLQIKIIIPLKNLTRLRNFARQLPLNNYLSRLLRQSLASRGIRCTSPKAFVPLERSQRIKWTMDGGYLQGRRSLKFALLAVERGYLYPPRSRQRDRHEYIDGFGHGEMLIQNTRPR
ncbi:hypothetical protein PUN28_000117 [Cardiocondyla obscurior]|uniref:Uncharacterized protein n=1 Tax=Cardiocondyla obscurior TaxID=286306 RepID=A0AAW2GY42_9HYME